MKRLLKYIFSLLLIFLMGSSVYSTHNRAGEISYEQIGPLTLRVTLTTYTKTSSVSADRDSVEIFWGDGSSQFVKRGNGWGDPQPNDVKINYYSEVHTYPARATYTISMFDPNRVGGILNVNYPDSESVPFYLETTITFLNTQFQGENNSSILLQAPIDFGCVGEVFTHNPNAYDVDGDSLSYLLIIPLQGQGAIVPDYNYPDEIGNSSQNQIYIDVNTGDLTWDSPAVPGEYNIAIKIEEYRQGTLISSMIRDMQIFIIDDCQNSPPEIDVIEELCVFAGDTLNLDVKVNDPNSGQQVRLEASGVPFYTAQNLATLSNSNEFKDISFNSKFTWITSCEDISEQYYQIIFKAMDNGFSDTSGLATLHTFRVKVIAPPPDSLRGQNFDNYYMLHWQFPYECAFADEEYFRGFSIWRSEQSIDLFQGECENGLEGKGYEIIAYQTNLNNGIDYYYEDFDVELGLTYCYRVVPEFAKISFDGFPYNPVSGRASNEVCLTIPLNLPYLTKISIDSTDISNGEIDLAWVMLDPQKFDSITYPPPYEIELFKSINGIDYESINHPPLVFPHMDEKINGAYTNIGLNTLDFPHQYLLDLYSGESKDLVATSLDAASLFLIVNEDNNVLRLEYEADVPWINHKYEIFRKADNEQNFSQIDESIFNEWEDNDVVNGKEYCYFIRSLGNYQFRQEDTLVNYSQIICSTPNDQEPPCPPELEIFNSCDTLSSNAIEEGVFALIQWHFDQNNCDDLSDLITIRLWYAADSAQLFEPILDISSSDLIGDHPFTASWGVKGCYALTAIDNNGNESQLSNFICIENCPYYELPNVFTPNNDGRHDTLKPRVKRHIYSIDMKIYNQWGQLVFQTFDPDINWDGSNLRSEKLAEGVYHYICTVNDTVSHNNAFSTTLSGFIHLLRGE